MRSELMRPDRGQCFITEHVVPDVFRSLRQGIGLDEDEYMRSLTTAGVLGSLLGFLMGFLSCLINRRLFAQGPSLVEARALERVECCSLRRQTSKFACSLCRPPCARH